MEPVLLVLALAVGLAALVFGLRGALARRRATARLARVTVAEEDVELEDVRDFGDESLVRRRVWPIWAAGIGTLVVTLFLVRFAVPLSVALSFFAGVVAWRLEERRLEQLIVKLESQLADAIDLVIGSVRAGGTIVDAMAHSADRVLDPVGGAFRDLVERLRIGQNPREVLTAFRERIPLDSFRLFTFTVGTNWEGGAGHANALSSVGRAVRDRVALRRRLRTQTVETELSVVGVLALTYGLAYLVAHSSTIDFMSFAKSPLGQSVVSTILFMQAVGIVWVQRISKIRV